MQAKMQKYPWAKELEKTVISSLTTTFGLDFLLFEDKKGGNVDTVQNVRLGIYATDKEKNIYNEKEKYNSNEYHSDNRYIEQGRVDKRLQQKGLLVDEYRNSNFKTNENRDLDHIISAHEIHNDPGRLLAELNGINLANQNSNLTSTSSSINRTKSNLSITDFISKRDQLIKNKKTQLKQYKTQLEKAPSNSKEQLKKIKNAENYIKQMESVDPEAMLKTDLAARKKYEHQINTYYTSPKFIKNSLNTSAQAGLKMGYRQMLGLFLAEIWFELRDSIPEIIKKIKKDFEFTIFIEEIKKSIQRIWKRVTSKFKDFLNSFKDGAIGGFFANLSTVIINIFSTTGKLAVKIIRETWTSITSALKLIIFNPNNLSFLDICKALTSILTLAVSTVAGTFIYKALLPICSFPFGSEVAAFLSALVTGVLTLGLNYFLLHSKLANKLWEFVESLIPHATTIKKFQEINIELDRYLGELKNLEFVIDTNELEEFTVDLSFVESESDKGKLLAEMSKKRNIELPFEAGNRASTNNWLLSLGENSE